MGRRKKSDLENLAPNGAVPTGEFVEEFVVPARYDADGVQSTSAIGADGREYPDPVPMSAPLGYEAPLGLMEMIKLMIKRGQEPVNDFDIEETFEEAEDFEIEDDKPDPLTEFEKVFEPKPVVVPPVVAKPEVPVVASSSEAAVPPVSTEPLKPT